MYTLLCSGGFPVPEKTGMLTIDSVLAVPLVQGSAVDVELRDDSSGAAPASDLLHQIISLKGDGNSTLSTPRFDPPLKTRKGLRATKCTNAVVFVYVR